MTDLDLDRRDGLPEPLRVLLAERPREGWREDPHFDGLVSFWLERHLMFRRLLEAMTAETREALAPAGAVPEARLWAGRLSRRGGMFVQELHGHHMIEDQHYFPRLAALEPRLERGFEILDRDHQALDLWLGRFVEAANAGIGAATAEDTPAPAMRDAVGGVEAELIRLTRLLDRHLSDEEDLIVPVILRHGVEG